MIDKIREFTGKKGNFNIISFLFLIPFTIMYLGFSIYPIFRGFWISLHKWSMIRKIEFLGIENYLDMLKDPHFWQALGNTGIFVLISTPTLIISGLILALICNQKFKGAIILKLSFFMPYVLSVAVISILMSIMFRGRDGFVNVLLNSLGIEMTIHWLASTPLAWFVITFATVWWTSGFNMILYLASLKEIPASYYDAAKVDGATNLQAFFYITLPLLKPITWTLLLLQLIASAKVFSQIWLITRGGPGTSTRPIIQYIYEIGFRQNNIGYSAAMAYTLFMILVIISIVIIKLRERTA